MLQEGEENAQGINSWWKLSSIKGSSCWGWGWYWGVVHAWNWDNRLRNWNRRKETENAIYSLPRAKELVGYHESEKRYDWSGLEWEQRDNSQNGRRHQTEVERKGLDRVHLQSASQNPANSFPQIQSKKIEASRKQPDSPSSSLRNRSWFLTVWATSPLKTW